MNQRSEMDSKQGVNAVGACFMAGLGFGLGLGLLVGISFGNVTYTIVVAACGAVMGLAIGESNKNLKESQSF
jgi:hypothetical protein